MEEIVREDIQRVEVGEERSERMVGVGGAVVMNDSC